jgi:hypothetical protein
VQQIFGESFERLTTPKPWSADELEQLVNLRRQAGLDWSEIAIRLDRTESGVKSKMKYIQYEAERSAKQPSVPFEREPIPDSVLIDRARRLAASARDLTASICGDPPRGYSALDRRMV